MSKEEAKPAEGGAAPAAAKAPSPWIPVIAVLVLMPVISFAATQFLIMPRVLSIVGEKAALGGDGAAAGSHGAKGESHGGKEAKPAADHHGGKESKEGKGKEGKGGESTNGKFSFDFENVVVNLSGSLGTKYLKTSFTLYSANANLKKLMEENKKQLMDVAINVLSSRSMADLEAAGAKNVVRNDLMANFNEALRSDIIEQIFYTEFVVQ